jgi:hypothetical protein
MPRHDLGELRALGLFVLPDFLSTKMSLDLCHAAESVPEEGAAMAMPSSM